MLDHLNFAHSSDENGQVLENGDHSIPTHANKSRKSGQTAW